MDIRKAIIPKRNGGTNIVNNYGFSSTINNNGSSNTNINTNNLTVNTLNSTNITVSQLIADNADITTLNSTTINTGVVNANTSYINNSYVSGNLDVDGSTTLNQLIVDGQSTLNGDMITYGNVTHTSSPAFSKTFDIQNVIAYLGSNNYFNELIGGVGSTLTAENITTDYLTVLKSAHFFELIIDKVKSVGGTVILTPADGFDVEIVENADINSYTYLYWRASSEIATGNVGQTLYETQQTMTEKVSVNMWKASDQAICQSFNIHAPGTYHDVSNHYWWRLVDEASESPVIKELDGEKYYFHWIKLSDETYDTGSTAALVGDSVAMLGNKSDTTRQGAVVISAYPSTYLDRGYSAPGEETIPAIVAPYLAQYIGIEDFNLGKYRHNWIATNSTTLQGNIKLSGGSTVEQYVQDKIDDIESGDQFFTNVLVFSNQNINVPCSYDGIPIVTSSTPNGSYIYAYHGNTALNISTVSFTPSTNMYSNIYNGSTAWAYCGNLPTLMVNDVNEVKVTVNAYLSGTSGTTIQYNGSLFYNKIKNGETGIDGKTPLVYDIVSDKTSRTWNSETDTPSSSTITIHIRKTDASNTTNPISNVSTIPTGFTLWSRYYNHNTGTFSSYTNRTSTFNDNGGYYTVNDSSKRSYEFYLVYGSTSPSQSSTIIYDVVSVPMIVDGKNGEDGIDGVNGTNIICTFSQAKCSCGLDDTLRTAITGQLYYRNGPLIDTSYNFSNYNVRITNDIGGNQQPASLLTYTLTPSNAGVFSWTPSAITNYHDYSYIYRPTTLMVNIYDNNNANVGSVNIPVTFEAGAVLNVTDTINAAVQDAQGEIDQLEITAQGLRNDVNNNSGRISTLQQTATDITARLEDVEESYVSNSYLGTYYITKTTTESYINASADSIKSYVGSYYQTLDAMGNYSTTTQMNSAIEQSYNGIMSQVSANYETKIGANTQYNSLSSRIDQTASNISLYVNNTSNVNYLKANDFSDQSKWVFGAAPTSVDPNEYMLYSGNETFIDNNKYTALEIDMSPAGTSNDVMLFARQNYTDEVTLKAGTKLYIEYYYYIEYPDNYSKGLTAIGADMCRYRGTSRYIQATSVYVDGVKYTNASGTAMGIGTNDGRAYTQCNPDKDNNWHVFRGEYIILVDMPLTYFYARLYGWRAAARGSSGQPTIRIIQPRMIVDMDGQMKSTGIDITNGKITLNADNTEVTGDLDLRGTFNSYNSTSWDEVILNAGTGQVLKIRGASGYEDETFTPATGATHQILCEINIKKDADSLRATPEIILRQGGNNSPIITIDPNGFFYEPTGSGTGEGHTWVELLALFH